MFDNRYEFKREFTPLLKYFYIKHVLYIIENPQANDLVERFYQVILNMLVTKDLDNKLFCSDRYRCSSVLYLLSMLAQEYNIIVDSGIVYPGHDREVVYGLKAT